jgi:hypothetical protein
MVVVNQMTANSISNEPDWIPAARFARARMTNNLYNNHMLHWRPKKLFLIVFFFICCIQVFTSRTSAAENDQDFITNLHSAYTVNNQGLATVEYEFEITNQTPTTFVKQYAIRLQQTGLENITAVSQGKSLEPNITIDDDQTNIALSFKDKVVGQGKQRKFSIRYTSPQIALITGQVLEVRIPEVANNSQYNQRTITLITPRRFDLPYRVDPKPDSTKTGVQTISQEFTSLDQAGILAIFGKEQIYNLSLRYFLDNPSGSPVTTQIALPPTTQYQELVYHSLDPEPLEVHQDVDGNWLAEYLLRPHGQISVNAAATARIRLDPDLTIPITQPITDHTKAKEFWSIDHPTITNLSSSATTVAELYQLVIEKLNYTDQELTNNITRVGAVGALNQPNQAVCQEFADLFITLVRSKGIPARRVAGYAFIEDEKFRPSSLEGDVLHAWAQFFNTSTNHWQSVDPTWEDTTGGIDYFSQFDLNHIAFAFNGQSSSLPYPAGFYKQHDSPTQDVVVELTDTFPGQDPNFKLEVEPNSILGIKLPGLYKLKITNLTGSARYFAQINVGSESKAMINPSKFFWSSILPFETKSLNIFVTKPGLQLEPILLNLEVQLGEDEKTIELKSPEEVAALPAIFNSWQQFVFIIGLAGGCVILALTTGSLLVLRQKRLRHLRRQSQKP